MAAAGTLLGALADRVGDRLQVEGISLEVGDPRRATEQARAGAYADAVARAGHLAELAGTSLGEVQAMVEGGLPGGAVPMPGVRALAAKDVSIEPGETTIGASLTVTFALA